MRRCCQDGANENRGWPIYGRAENSGMGHGADRALMARELGIFRVYVDCLDKAGERDQQDT
jgi:hypothetical protein